MLIYTLTYFNITMKYFVKGLAGVYRLLHDQCQTTVFKGAWKVIWNSVLFSAHTQTHSLPLGTRMDTDV